MMKFKVLLILIAAFMGSMTIGRAQSPSDPLKLTDKVIVQFPEIPKKQDLGPALLYNLRLADSTANFLALASDLQKSNGLDAATLSEASMQPEFWDQAEQSFMTSVGDGAKLITRDMKNVSGIDVMEMVITRPTDNGETNTLTVWIFVEGVYSLNFIHTNRGGKADAKKRDAFFSSIKID